MSFKAGQRVMCVADFSKSRGEGSFGAPPIYPKLHEELLIIRLNGGHLVFREYEKVYGQYGPKCAWCPTGFVPLAPMEEAIAQLMESTVEEPEPA